MAYGETLRLNSLWFGLTEEEPVHRRRVSQVLWFAWWVVASGLGMWMHPNVHGHGTHEQLGLPPCPSVMLLGRPCPGCGLTTSWTALLHGQFATAFHAHPLGPLLYVCFSLSAIGGLVAYFRGRRITTVSPMASKLFTWVAIVFLGFGFARMLLVSGIATPYETLFPVASGR